MAGIPVLAARLHKAAQGAVSASSPSSKSPALPLAHVSALMAALLSWAKYWSCTSQGCAVQPQHWTAV